MLVCSLRESSFALSLDSSTQVKTSPCQSRNDHYVNIVAPPTFDSPALFYTHSQIRQSSKDDVEPLHLPHHHQRRAGDHHQPKPGRDGHLDHLNDASHDRHNGQDTYDPNLHHNDDDRGGKRHHDGVSTTAASDAAINVRVVRPVEPLCLW